MFALGPILIFDNVGLLILRGLHGIADAAIWVHRDER